MIHMTYKKNIPRIVFSRWKTLNPEYDIHLSLDNECISFLREKFNTLLSNLFQVIPIGMYKADLWRLAKLYHEGGVYADVDLVPYIQLHTLDPTIFYSCLADDTKSIFQAFMVQQDPKNPLMLCFLISYCINRPDRFPNGPCYDMANVLKYNINIPDLEHDTLYTIPEVKLKLSIGSSNTLTKVVSLGYFPNVEYTLRINSPYPTEKFQVNLVESSLVITRIDSLQGWTSNPEVEIGFGVSQQVYLFKEKVPPEGHPFANVTYNGTKILDSRDPIYFKNKGW